MKSWNNNECAFVLTCCGCAPPIGLIKAALLIGPVVAVFTTGTTLISILLIPHTILLTYYTLIRTDTIGPNLKTLGFLLLPIPLLLSVPLTVLGSMLFSIGLGLFYPLFMTFKSYCSGWDAITYAFIFLGDFWDMRYHGYFNYLENLRNPHKDAPWDINFLSIFVGLFIALIGSIFVGICVLVLSILKFIPGLFFGWLLMFRTIADLKKEFWLVCMCFPVWIVAVLVWPVVAVLVFGICVLGGFSAGAWSAVIAYQDGLKGGFQSMYTYVYRFDKRTNKLMEIKNSCLPKLAVKNERKPVLALERLDPLHQPRVQILPTIKQDASRIPTPQVWDLFFEMAPLYVQDALADGLLKREELSAIENNCLPQRIASLVYFGVLDRSSSISTEIFHTLRTVVGLGPDRLSLEYTGGIDILVLSNGLNLDQSNRPMDPLANFLFPEAVKLTHSLALAKLAPSHALTDAHLTYIKQYLLARNPSDPPPPPITFSQKEIENCEVIAYGCLLAGNRAAAAPTYLRRLRFALRNFTGPGAVLTTDALDRV